MKTETRNLIANYIGRGWVMAINLIATPLLIKILGIESYGLIGFYTTLYGLINLLDFGISPTINRELARYSVDQTQENRGRDLVRTLEIGYWIIGILLGVLVFFGAPIIAEKWLQSKNLSIDTLIHSIRLMGFLIVLEWPITFYQGCLLGLQRHIRLNLINIVNSLLKFGGALLILTYVSPTIDTFFSWQLGVSTLQITLLVISVWLYLPAKQGNPVFDLKLLENIWKFALSLNIISFLGLVISQIDQIFVSHNYNLEIFGFYNIALMINSGLSIVVSPINLTYFPRFSALVAQKDKDTFNRTYHQACQLVSAAVLPIATVGILFSRPIILVWTGDPQVADHASTITSIVLAGTLLNALIGIPYQAQVAHGWTRLALWSNVICIPLVLLLVFLFNSIFGVTGVAAVRVVYGVIGLCIVIFIMYRYILIGELKPWILNDILPSLLVCASFSLIKIAGDIFFPEIINTVPAFLFFSLAIQLVVIFSVRYTREKSLFFIQNIRNKYAKTIG
ncbi:lipopolysaccharide biosynthesis protein [Leptolinea tardivitalis]|uniref:Polysaccharide biosynthesis protein C-terminal domain-containing protein n=1 Tax=Leptolinea tardivitalis TaxID=229920 RepID=A0A0P6WKF7_9CHLR|nr:oligosaccharide flippase family protein [Leptolinea tardivitalis]KPL70216.1 hypothetical protein ADM99_13595 [Leptolinea tardivitalis]GAP21753.1 membrane protein [Leptolinea tardivitalis]